jgi:hypothetical protein
MSPIRAVDEGGGCTQHSRRWRVTDALCGGWSRLLARSRRYTTANVATFVQRAAIRLDIEVEASSDPENFILRLPANQRGAFPEFGNRTVVAATTRRRGWNPASEVALIDFSGTFLRYLVTAVTAVDFGGSYATFAEEANLYRI